MKKIIPIVSLLFGCSLGSSSNNNVSINVTPGQCVQQSFYAKGTSIIPAIANNPAIAPYCAAVTVQNNNNGRNANNIQAVGSGFSVNYTANTARGVAASKFSNQLCDNVASAGTCSKTKTQQNVGNINLYDPKNCVTTQGSKVVTLGANGGKCTFYLQVASEGFTVGQYSMNMNYNYTNGNANYGAATKLNQSVRLYATSSTGIFAFINEIWSNNINNINTTQIVRNKYGNVYFATDNGVYQYDGINSPTQLGGAFPGGKVSYLILDANNNLYASNGGQIYYYTLGSTASWTLLNIPGAPTSLINGIAVANNTLFITTPNISYQCTGFVASPLGYTTCQALSSATSPAVFNNNSLFTLNGQLFTGSANKLYNYNNSLWLQFATTPSITGNISSINASANTLYFSQLQGTEAAVYACNLVGGGSQCNALASRSGKTLTGNAANIVTDGIGNLFILGGNLNSADFTNAPYLTAYISNPQNATAISNWLPIVNPTTATFFNNGIVATILTK